MLEKLQTAVSEDAAYFYSASIEKDTKRGCIGHLRGYFGSSGETFWANWFEHLPALKTPAFRAELDAVVQALTEQGWLQSRSRMHQLCMSHPERSIIGGVAFRCIRLLFSNRAPSVLPALFPACGRLQFLSVLLRPAGAFVGTVDGALASAEEEAYE